MNLQEQIGRIGIVPVVVLKKASDAIPTADALSSGGIQAMEITLRTEAGLESIRQVAQNRPEVLVGAGTVLTLAQCQASVDAGAKFIVSPGFDDELVAWCVKNNVPVIPGCVTPTEITRALSYGLKILKFFPANVYGGISAIKALSGPFPSLRFIPTGGVNPSNLSTYASAPMIHAVGGSWMCAASDIAAGNFEKIAALCREARGILHGFSPVMSEVSDTMPVSAGSPVSITDGLSAILSEDAKAALSAWAGTGEPLVLRCNNLERAAAFLQQEGYSTGVFPDGAVPESVSTIYLRKS